MRVGANLRIVIKSMIVSYLITGGLLVLTAFLLYKLEPQQSLVAIGIQAIYVLGSFLGGFLAGKGTGTRKFFWGMVTGAAYFLLLLCVSLLTGGGIHSALRQVITTFLLCLGGGMLGGMLS